LAFDVALHFGTLLAVVWYFRNEVVSLIRGALQIVTTRKIETVEQYRAAFIIVATIPGGIAGLLLEKKAETTFRDPALIAWALIGMGIVLWAIDKYASQRRHMNQMTWWDSIVMGIAQIFALIPGFSRSGTTITAGRLLGLDRNGSAAFSFLMSIPIIAAAVVLKVPKVVQDGGLSMPLIAGVVASALSGALAITGLLKYVSKRSYGAFAVYRIVIGIIVLAVYYMRG
jgi:undecaprenyl-diphosphatase